MPLNNEKIQVLLVDDIPSKVLALESILSELKITIVKACSGQEALRQLLHNDFAVILLDVNMPIMDGFETATLIRQRKQSELTPIIFITAINMTDSHVSQGYSLKAVDYIFTPVVPEILRAKVSVFVDLYRKTDQLKQQAKKLARSNSELEQFAYLASHDLKEPLRMVSGYTQLLAKRYRGKLDPDADEFMAFITDGVTRMHALIDDLLIYSRLGKSHGTIKSTDCESILKEVLINLHASIEESKALITHDPLPSLMADNTELVQLFQNLIGNAIKFRAKAQPQIHISARSTADDWLFTIRDNGIGIDPQYSDRIFVIFQRLHGRKEYPGTGIGLAICKKIVEQQGGRIWME